MAAKDMGLQLQKQVYSNFKKVMFIMLSCCAIVQKLSSYERVQWIFNLGA